MRRGRFTFVTDPTIERLGSYNRETGSLNDGDRVFLFNAGEFVAVRGQGLSPFTSVRINDKPVTDLRVEDQETLSFQVPDDTIGSLVLEISNDPAGVDTRTDASLAIRFEGARRLTASSIVRRAGQLLFAADGTKAQLFGVSDGATPVLLSTLGVTDDVVDAALSGEYLVLITGAASTIEVFDITNVYAPEKLNEIVDPLATPYRDPRILGDSLVVRAGGDLFVGNLRAFALETFDAGIAIDLAVLDDRLLVLTDTTLDVYSLLDLADPEVRYGHGVAGARAVHVSPGRLVIEGAATVELLNSTALTRVNDLIGGLITQQDFEAQVRIGRFTFPAGDRFRDARVNGELLVAQVANRLRIYDVTPETQTTPMALRPLADVSTTYLNGLNGLHFNGDLLEWITGASYYNAQIPLVNAWRIDPPAIASATESVRLDIVGGIEAWGAVDLIVTDDLGIPVNGGSVLQGNELLFEIAGDAFEVSALYQLSLSRAPQNAIDGGAVVFDMPLEVSAVDLFGASPVRLLALEPVSIQRNTPTLVRLRGQQLQSLESIELAGVTLTSAAWQLVDQGTIEFTLAPVAGGLQTLIARTTDGRRLSLPAAVQVVDPIDVTAVQANHASGAQFVSSTGGNVVTVTGAGLNGDLMVHWYPFDQGFDPNPGNEVAFRPVIGGIEFTTGPAIAGLEYQVTLVRASTGETVPVTDADKRILAVDDTQPGITVSSRLSQTTPLILSADEPIAAGGVRAFEVIKTFRDYSGTPPLDVSDRFEDLRQEGQLIELRLIAGASLEPNATYQIQVFGLQDEFGNPALDSAEVAGGTFTDEFVARDLLSPLRSSIEMTETGSGDPVTPALELKRGASYEFALTAEDNYLAPDQLNYDYRLSSDGGVNFGPWRSAAGGLLDLTVDEEFASAVFRVRVSDGINRVETEFSAFVADANLSLLPGAAGFSVNPGTPEELSRVDIEFGLTGDLDLLTLAEVRVGDGSWQTVPFDPITGALTLSYLNPSLEALGAADSADVPVRLRIEFGSLGARLVAAFDRSYTLLADATAPTVQFVSPLDGSAIPIGVATDLFLQTFDRNGIVGVDVCVFEVSAPADPFADAGCTDIGDAQRYPLTPADSTPLVVVARARDARDNVSSTATLNLAPVTATGALPRLAVLAPANGATFREGEPIAFELLMGGLTDATLALQIAGDAGDPRNPAPVPIARGVDEPELVIQTVNAPLTGESVVVIADLSATVAGAGTLNTRSYINVREDSGIEAPAVVDARPTTTLLGGTTLLAGAAIDPSVTDADPSSAVTVLEDLNELADLPLDGRLRPVTSTVEPIDVVVRATLRDRSAHEVVSERTLTKVPYFSAASQTEFASGEPGEELVALMAVPGWKTAGVIRAVNRAGSGYALIDEDGVLYESAFDRLVGASFSGYGFALHVDATGDDVLSFVPLDGAGAQTAIATDLFGELLGASGHTIFVREGALLRALVVAGDRLVPTIGVVETQPIVATDVAAGELYVLTAGELTRLAPDGLALAEVQTLPVAGGRGLAFGTGAGVVWTGNDLIRFDYSAPDFSETSRTVWPGDIHAARIADELMWIRQVDADLGMHWSAVLNGEPVGAVADPAGDLVVVPGRLYTALQTGAGYRIDERAIMTIDAGAGLTASPTEQPAAWAVETGFDPTLGVSHHFLEDDSGIWLPSRVTLGAGITLSTPRGANAPAALLRRNHANVGAATDTQPVSFDTALQTTVSATEPVDGATLRQGGRIPVVVTLDPGARVVDQLLLSPADPAGVPMAAPVPGAAHQCLALPSESASHDFAYGANGGVEPSALLTLIANDVEGAAVTISQPQNNAVLSEGDRMRVAYEVEDLTGGTLRFVEVTLFDFNGQPLHTAHANALTGSVTFRLPAVQAQDNYLLTVRAYFDADYRFSEASVGLRISPKLNVAAPAIEGISSLVYAGAETELRLTGGMAGTTSISIFDQNGALLASADEMLAFQVPATATELVVRAVVDDGYGNQQTTEKTVSVAQPFRLIDDGDRQPFHRALNLVDTQWFATGRDIVTGDGQLIRRFRSSITAMGVVAGYVVVATADSEIHVLTLIGERVSDRSIPGTLSSIISIGPVFLGTIDGDLYGFSLLGPQLFEHGVVYDAGSVFDLVVAGDRFHVATSTGLFAYDTQFALRNSQTGVEFRNLIALASERGHVWGLSSDGHLARSGGSLSAAVFPNALDGNGLIGLAGRLLVFGADGIDVLEIGNETLVEHVARFVPGAGDWSARDPVLADGKLLLGGSRGAVLRIDRGASDYRTLFQSADGQPTGDVRTIAIDGGRILASAGSYGALRIGQNAGGTWQVGVFPEPGFSVVADQVLLGGRFEFVRQPDLARVLRVDRESGATNQLLNGQQTDDIAFFGAREAGDLLVVQGTSLAVIDGTTGGRTVELTLPAAQSVRALTTAGDVAYIAGGGGEIYQLQLDALDLDGYRLAPIATLDVSGNARMAANGDYLFVADGASVHRVDLQTHQVTTTAWGDAVDALAIGDGLLWLAEATAGARELVALDPVVLIELPGSRVAVPAAVEALAVDEGKAALALGGDGALVLAVPERLRTASAAIEAPAPAAQLMLGETLPVRLSDRGNVTAVGYFVDGVKVAARTTPDVNERVVFPNGIANGTRINVSAWVQDAWGNIVASTDHAVLVRSEAQVVNDFTVQLTIDPISYVPAPLRLAADVLGSVEPVRQVEYYVADAVDGPFEWIGRSLGPDYVLNFDLGAAERDVYVIGRAIDGHGNVAESAPTLIERRVDNAEPVASLGAVPSNTVSGNTIVAGHGYVVRFDVSDAESGVKSAFLSRDGRILSARFEPGVTDFPVAAEGPGTATYVLEVLDASDNLTQTSVTFDIVADQAPELVALNAPASVRERDPFSVTFTARDDAAVDRVELVWNGFTTTVAGDGSNEITRTVQIIDNRADRVGTGIVEELTVTVFDEFGRASTPTIANLDVTPDAVPDVANMSVQVADFALYGSSQTLTLSQLNAVDDGPLTGSLIEVFDVADGSLIASVVPDRNTETLRLTMPTVQSGRATYEFLVSFQDRLGQVDQGQQRSIGLLRQPNELRFEDQGDSAINPAATRVGEAPAYQAIVLDAAVQPVQQQRVRFQLRNPASGTVVELGTPISDADGLVAVSLNTVRSTGQYEVLASLPDFPAISSITQAVTLAPGDTVDLLVMRVPPVTAGGSMALTVNARDIAGNVATDDNTNGITYSLSDQFVVTPAAGLTIDTAAGVTTAAIGLTNGTANVELTAATASGDYEVQIAAPPANDIDVLRYDHDGLSQTEGLETDRFDVTVVPGLPTQVVFDIPTQRDEAVPTFGTNDQADLVLRLADVYGNLVADVPAGLQNWTATLSVDGSAVIDGLPAGSNLVDVTGGVGPFVVTNDVPETVFVTLQSVAPGLPGISLPAPRELLFQVEPPALIEAAFVTTDDPGVMRIEFVFNEEVEVSAAGDFLTLTRGGVPVAGTFELTGADTAAFTAAAADIPLNRCLDYDTAGSVLVSTTSGLALEALAGSDLCSPVVRLPQPAQVDFLENDSFSLGVEFGSGISAFSISNGQAHFDDQSQGFSFSNRTVRAPNTAGVYADGRIFTFSVSGTRLVDQVQQPILVANTLQFGVLQRGADLDGDGLTNDIEHGIVGLDPRSADSDGNGTNDDADDLDGDGLTNLREVGLGTRLDDADSDSDGLSDGVEVDVEGSNPLVSDTDGDGLSDGDEVNLHGSSPILVDSDGDTINDNVEVALSLDPSDPNDATADVDGDGLNAIEEIAAGTAIFDEDSDDDGLDDGAEVALGTNPLNADTDGDGLTDGEEVAAGTDPLTADSQAPTVSLASPDPAFPLARGTTILLEASALDDGRIDTVEFYVNGVLIGVDTRAPFERGLVVPAEGANLTVSLAAIDTAGNRGESAPVIFDLVDDPLTDVTGRVIDANGFGLPDLDVRIGTRTTTTDTNGDYAFTGITSIAGDIVVEVSGQLPGSSVTLVFTSAPTAPVPEGVTVIADIVFEGAQSSRLYATTNGDSVASKQNRLWEIDQVTGSARQIGAPAGVLYGLTDVAASPLDDAITAVDGDSEAANQVLELARLNGSVLASSVLESGGSAVGSIDGFADSGVRQYFATATAELYTFTPATSTVTSMVLPLVCIDLGYDRVSGNIWAVRGGVSSGSVIDLLNPDTGTLLATHALTEESATAIAVSSDGRLFVAVEGGTRLVSVDPLTGATSDVGTTFGSGIVVTGLGFAGTDTDNDGLLDTDEANLGTDPDNADTDGDGLLDGFEVRYGLDPFTTDESALDTDGDGLTNAEEQALLTNPLAADSDADGLDDNDELTVTGTSPINRDTDADGIIDAEELVLGSDGFITDPLDADSDDDGMTDGFEIQHGFNPNDPADGAQDADGDGLTNAQEEGAGTDPNNADSDADGLNDGDEGANGTNPNVADTDGDRLPDGLEVAAGSDPLVAGSADVSALVTALTVTPPALDVEGLVAADIDDVGLTVVADLLAGGLPFTLDVTDEVHGTRYTSADTGVVASLGGGLFDVVDFGITTIDVTLGAVTETVDVTVALPGGVITVGDLVLADTTQTYDGNVIADSVTLTEATLDVTGTLIVRGDVSAEGGELAAAVIAQEVRVGGSVFAEAGDFRIDVPSGVDVDGNFSVIGARITVPVASLSSPLNLSVGGTLNVDGASSIDLTGGGFRPDYYGPDGARNEQTRACHGGRGDENRSNCIYGRYAQARFAGSSGNSSSAGAGGGFLAIAAGTVQLDGAIRANGTNAFYAGAGGGVDIQATSFAGAGSIQARGGNATSSSTSSWSGGGGRISVRADDVSGYTGAYDAAGGARTTTSNVGGAGTVFVKETAAPSGVLRVDNAGNTANASSTIIEHVGRVRIAGVRDRGDGTWEIETREPGTAGSTATTTVTNGAGIDQPIPFSVGYTQNVNIRVAASGFTPHTFILRDDGDPTDDDIVAEFDTATNINYELDPGDYVVVVGIWWFTTNDDMRRLYSGTHTVTVDGGTRIWTPTDTAYDFGLQGLKVDLDAEDDTSPLYTIESNDPWRLIIRTLDDLYPYEGEDMIGVHEFDRLEIGGGASVNFGGDRYTGDLVMDVTGSIHNVGPVAFDGFDVGIGESLRLDGNDVRIDGDLTVDGGTLTLGVRQPLHVTGNLTLAGNAVLAAPTATSSIIYGIDVVVDGDILIEAGSTVTVDRRGYPVDFYGPDNARDELRRGCHGGRSDEQRTDCIYGRYREARFAGSSGNSSSANAGGGLVRLTGTNVVLDGSITANGGNAFYSAAGGGVHIDATSFAGSGLIQARGGNATSSSGSSWSGGGGRISVLADDVSGFAGSYDAAGGRRTPTSNVAGAGTVFVSQRGEDGTLTIDNAGATSLASSTIVEHVGRHTIDRVTDLGDGRWEVSTIGADDVAATGIRAIVSGTGQANPVPFTVPVGQTVNVRIAANGITPHTMIFRDDGNLTDDDYITDGDTSTNFNVTLDAGDYLVVVGEWWFNNISDIRRVYTANWTLTVGTTAPIWAPSDPRFDRGIQGLTVDLNAEDLVGPFYPIESNDGWSFVVETLDDLSGVVGNDMIGVHQLDSLVIGGGASVDFGGDRYTGSLAMDSTGSLHNVGVAAFGDITVAAGEVLRLDGSQIRIDGDVVVDGGTLVLGALETVEVTGGVSLSNGAVLRAPSGTTSPNRLYPLRLDVAGDVTIDATSTIDVSGRGYPPDRYGPDFANNELTRGCHGGRGDEHRSNCIYGRYEQARFAGSSGNSSSAGAGGGLLELTAANLVLDGSISANGVNQFYSGAGGGVHLSVATLSGAGLIEARGGNATSSSGSSWSGGGGRISVYADDTSAFTGTYTAAGGNRTPTSNVGGAGTVFVKDAGDQHGRLIVTNGGPQSRSSSTLLEHVGRHRIEAVTNLGADRWEIDTLPATTLSFVVNDTASNDAGVTRPIPFTVTAAQTINIRISNSGFTPHTHLFVDDGDLTEDDFIRDWDNSTNITTTLQPGDYVLVLGLWWNNTLQDIYRNYTGSYTVTAGPAAPPWRASNPDLEWGIQGLKVDLDASDLNGPLYTVESNDGWRMIVNSADDLSTAVGNELIGVHEFDGLSVNAGASVDFGGDRYTLTSGTPELDGTGEIVNAGAIELTEANVGPGETLRIDGSDVALTGDITVDGGTLIVGVTGNLDVGGNVNVIGGGQVTAAPGAISPNRLYPVNLNVAGTVFVEAGASIDVTGRGYPVDRYGPDFASNELTRGCHGGRSDELRTDCTYGRYGEARFAGSSGNSSSAGAGGGLVRIVADQLILDGAIRANGVSQFYSSAGGGVHVDVNTFTGIGTIEALGGNATSSSGSSWSGGGGRISVHADDLAGYAGTYRADGGQRTPTSNVAGAGAVFVKSGADQFGRLIVDNDGVTSPSNGTEIDSVGRYTIHGVTDLGGDRWQIDTLSPNVVGESFTRTISNSTGQANPMPFTVLETQSVNVQVSISGITPHTFIFRDDGNLTDDDYVTDGDNNLSFNRTLEAGNYLLVIGQWWNNATSDIRRVYSASYTVTLSPAGRNWRDSNPAYDWGVQGLTVDLDAQDDASPLYTIESNDPWRLVIATPDDLSGVVGNELVGVHRFDQLRVTGGASVNFGGDRVDVVGNDAEVVNASLLGVSLTDALVDHFVANNVTGRVQVPGRLYLDDLTISAPGIELLDVAAAGTVTVVPGVSARLDSVQATTMVIDGATVTTQNLDVSGDVSIINNSLVTSRAASATNVRELSASVGGTLLVEAGSVIDVTEQGYLTHRYGPDASQSEIRHGCHGGAREGGGANCVYGRYANPRFGGSSGNNGSTNEGGGVVQVEAATVQLDGDIRANGGAQFYGAAGGAIRMDVGSLVGVGTLQARGGNSTSSSTSSWGGGGGRIAVYADDLSGYPGGYDAAGGRLDATRNIGGAGTVFLKEPADVYGRLVVDNGGFTAAGNTYIERIGRRTITDVTDLGDGRWEIDTWPDSHVRFSITETVSNGLATPEPFTVEGSQLVRLRVTASGFTPHTFVFRDDGDLTDDDYVTDIDTSTNATRTLAPGDYLLVMGVWWTNTVNDIRRNFTGTYTVTVENAASPPWLASNPALDFGVQGLMVDLDADDGASVTYPVSANGGYALTVETADDLSGVVGGELIGVHRFDELTVTGNAAAEFGGDRVEIADFTRLSVTSGASLLNLDLPRRTRRGSRGQSRRWPDPTAAGSSGRRSDNCNRRSRLCGPERDEYADGRRRQRQHRQPGRRRACGGRRLGQR